MTFLRSILASLVLLASAASAFAVNPSNPTYWYWVVADTNPTTQVWEATSGSFVSNTSSNYTTWLTLVAAQPSVFGGVAQTICNVVNNGSGHPRLTICPGNPGFSSGLTGQTKTITGVGGATGVNGAAVATFVDQLTIDMLTETFGGAYTSGGVIGSGTSMDTASNMNALINRYNTGLWAALQAGNPIATILTTTVLTNPVSSVNIVDMGSGSQTITMPQANLFGSIPIGQPITFLNLAGGSAAWTLKDSGGTTISTIPVGFSATIYLVANNSTTGAYEGAQFPSVAGVNCSGSPTSSFAAVAGIVTHC